MEVCPLFPDIPYGHTGHFIAQQSMFSIQETANLVIFTEEIFNRKAHFLYSVFQTVPIKRGHMFPQCIIYVLDTTTFDSNLLKLEFGSFISSANDVMLLVVRPCIFKNKSTIFDLLRDLSVIHHHNVSQQKCYGY